MVFVKNIIKLSQYKQKLQVHLINKGSAMHLADFENKFYSIRRHRLNTKKAKLYI